MSTDHVHSRSCTKQTWFANQTHIFRPVACYIVSLLSPSLQLLQTVHSESLVHQTRRKSEVNGQKGSRLKLVLYTTSLQEASWTLCKHLLLGQTLFTITLKVCSLWTVKECSRCLRLSLTGWFGLPRNTDVALLHEWAKWPWHWLCHTAAGHFYLVMLLRSFSVGCECKIINMWEVHNLIEGSHQSKIHKSARLKWHDAY